MNTNGNVDARVNVASPKSTPDISRWFRDHSERLAMIRNVNSVSVNKRAVYRLVIGAIASMAPATMAVGWSK